MTYLFSKHFLFLLLLLCLALPSTTVLSAPLVDTSESIYATVLPVGVDEVRWTEGFWADRVETCYGQSIPSMWELMREGKYKPFLEHFLIAAGQEEGGHHGAKWNDGDFYKWLEAAVIAYSATKDSELKQAIDRSVAAIAAAQREDGYIHTPVMIAQRNGDTDAKPFQDRHAFEMYNMGHLITTGCIHYRVTGSIELLAVAEKAANFLIDVFKNPTPELARNSVCPAHYMGAIELYRTTRDKRYLSLAAKFISMRDLVTQGGDDNQDRIPFAQQREAVGHAVRANYLNAGVADLYAETGDSTLLPPLESIWENMVGKKMYITGACGALYDGASPDGSSQQSQITRIHQAFGRNYQLPNTTAHNETCANIANLMWCWRMYLVTGEAKYLDVLETALYNSILSGVSLEGTEYFYVNPLRVTNPLPTKLRYPRTRQPFFTSFCCPPNVVRTIAEVAGYAYSKTDTSITVNIYGANDLVTEFQGQPLKLSQQTNYPWEGNVRFTINACPKKEFSLKLRIPGWASQATTRINEHPPIAIDDKSGFYEINRNWQPGDVVELQLPMPVRQMKAHPLVEELNNQVALQRGPIVYCLESQDLPEGVQLEQIVISSESSFTPLFNDTLLQGVTTLEGEALVKESLTWESQLYQEAKFGDKKTIALRLIPYYAWANRGPGEMSVWLPAE